MPGLAPAIVIEATGNTTVPVFVIVTPVAALIELRATLPKSIAVGDIENVDLTPVPDNATVFVSAAVACGYPEIRRLRTSTRRFERYRDRATGALRHRGTTVVRLRKLTGTRAGNCD